MGKEFQAVEYPNESAAQGAQTAILNHAKEKTRVNGKITLNANTWGYKLGVDGKCLVMIDERISDFPFSPSAIEIFNTDNLNYFPVDE